MTHRSRWARATTILVALVAAAVVVGILVVDPSEGLRFVPAILLVPVATWAFHGRPAVVVDDDGIVLRNVVRTITVPWSAVRGIEMRTALMVHTTSGTYTAWAAGTPGSAPAGRPTARTAATMDLAPEMATPVARNSQVYRTAAGELAGYVQRRWEAMPAADSASDSDTVRVRVHHLTLAALVGLAVLAVVGLRAG